MLASPSLPSCWALRLPCWSAALWFYDHSQLGDVINIVHAAVGPLVSDAGMYDWNIPWAQWKTGNLNG